MDSLLVYTHPELVRRYERLVRWAWSNGWDIGITSSSRSYAQQALWYQLYLDNQWPNLVADPDKYLGPFPLEVGFFEPNKNVSGMILTGSMHLIQKDGWSHALDIRWTGPSALKVHNEARKYGLGFIEAGEDWHMTWMDPWRGVYPVLEPDDYDGFDVHALAAMLSGGGEDIGDVRVNPRTDIIEVMLNDSNWYAAGDALEYIHRHLKHLDEGNE